MVTSNLTTTDFIFLLNKPNYIKEKEANGLAAIAEEFPYFQSAKVLYLKHLYDQDSYHYNTYLKKTAAFTTDRSILFEFITSDNFVTVQNELYNKKIAELLDLNVIDLEHVQVKKEATTNTNSLEESIKSSIESAKTPIEILEDKLQVGKPLTFTPQETHSFQEWLQLARLTPIKRTENVVLIPDEKQKKIELIDKFIEANPKISPISKAEEMPTKSTVREEKNYLMTETLAKVYLEQKKYHRAIQAYEILILKYPEKSSLFANRISDIKNLQQNNS